MRYLSIFIVCCALFAGCSSSRDAGEGAVKREVVDLYVGTVELPDGFIHSREEGIDTIIGHFTSADGHLVIHYDIAILGSAFASHIKAKDIISSYQTTVHGLTALIVVARQEDTKFVYITLPEVGPAIFYADIRDDADLEMVKKLAFSFRLKHKD